MEQWLIPWPLRDTDREGRFGPLFSRHCSLLPTTKEIPGGTHELTLNSIAPF